MRAYGTSTTRDRVSIYSSMSFEGVVEEESESDDARILFVLSCKSFFFSNGGFICIVGRVYAPKKLLDVSLIFVRSYFHMGGVFWYVCVFKERHLSHILTLSYFRVAFYH